MTLISRSIIKTALSLLFVILTMGSLSAQIIQNQLLSDLDIPIMPGFQEEDGSRVVFDTPEGRIIEVQTFGPHGMDKAANYYMKVLPSLSWRAWKEKSESCNGKAIICVKAQRDGEILTLKISKKNHPQQKTIIYFSVNPE